MRFISKALVAVVFSVVSAASQASLVEALGHKALQKFGEMQAQKSGTPAVAGGGVGFNNCPAFFPGGRAPVLPKTAPRDWVLRELCYDAFAVLHSGATRTPVFSVERLNRSQLQDAKGKERTDVFFADARLPSAERAELADYAGSGFDRGHMSPAADQPNAQAMAQSFSLANMIPQAPENNRKTWAGIEKSTRRYVERATGDVYVFTGPAFVGSTSMLKNRVKVPSHIYKLVYDASANRAWAFWVENTDAARASAPISYEELVSKVGIEFLPGIRPTN